MLRQKTACRNRTWEERNKLAETKRDNVATRFVNWMSTLGRTCRDIKNWKREEDMSRQGILCRDKKLKSNTGRILR